VTSEHYFVREMDDMIHAAELVAHLPLTLEARLHSAFFPFDFLFFSAQPKTVCRSLSQQNPLKLHYLKTQG